MQKLIIKNFGPIKDVKLEIKDFMVFIGPQASGKSTISKVIYFFQTIGEVFAKKMIRENIFNNNKIEISDFKKAINTQFLNIWSSENQIKYFKLIYEYSEYLKITVHNTDNKIPTFEFSEELEKVLTSIVSSQTINRVREDDAMSEGEYIYFTFLTIFFSKDRKKSYIPAGRSALATLSEIFQADFIRNEDDPLMQNFIKFIALEKKKFGQGLDLVIDRQLALEPDKVDKSTLKLAKKLIHKILKGEYKNGNGDKIILENDEYVFLNEASSGQQEAIWILYLLFAEILEQRKTAITIEEPEAHLYPVAQKDIVEMIALLFNTADNQVILTTHSPYILASINNLLYANKVGKNNETKVSQIIDKKLWLDYNRFEAFFVEKGTIRNIMDEEFQMIKNEAIDSASRIINQQFDDLYEFDN
ncbi:MAG: AAA family ATPase [Saprospiraceae bacterium]